MSGGAQATAEDVRWMSRAIELAALGRYSTSPNPNVGAVIVADGSKLAEGFHVRAGGPHAERRALQAAGPAARGATLYCTLEPCNHHGRTGPCTEAIVEAGVSRVVVGATDPNPRVSGAGVARLREAGVDVSTGVLEQACRELNPAFEHAMRTGRPLVTLKLGSSLDGRIATATGASRWITSPAARERVHRMRAEHDAILAGVGTVLADDPRLTARGVEPLCAEAGPVRSPLRVIVDSRLRIDPGARVFETPDAVVATALAEDALGERAAELRDRGVAVWSLPGDDGRVDLAGVIRRLGEQEIRSLMVEGGGVVSAALIGRALVDRVRLFLAPKFLGGDGWPTIGALGVTHPDSAPRLAITSVDRVGPDLDITARVVRSEA